jgi:hypothetical protein
VTEVRHAVVYASNVRNRYFGREPGHERRYAVLGPRQRCAADTVLALAIDDLFDAERFGRLLSHRLESFARGFVLL